MENLGVLPWLEGVWLDGEDALLLAKQNAVNQQQIVARNALQLAEVTRESNRGILSQQQLAEIFRLLGFLGDQVELLELGQPKQPPEFGLATSHRSPKPVRVLQLAKMRRFSIDRSFGAPESASGLAHR